MKTKYQYQLKHTLAIPNLWKVFSNQQSNKLRRYIWILVFVTCAGVFIYETMDRLGRLLHPQKSASITSSYEKILRFPAVTVCPGYPFRQSVLKRLDLDEFGCKPGQRLCAWDFPWSMATHTEGIIKSCIYKNRWSCLPGTEEIGIWTRTLTSIGRCFTYSAGEPTYIGGDSNGLKISVDPMLWDKVGRVNFDGIRVYIHSRHEKPIASISGININQGSAADFAVIIKDFNRVNDTQNNPCMQKRKYNQNQCVINCIHRAAVTKANTSCGAPFMKGINVKVCHEEKNIRYFMKTYNNLISNGGSWKMCLNQCPNICRQRIFTPITTSLGYTRHNDSNSLVNVTIFYKDMYLERVVECWDYSIQDFVSDTGGSLNLFLGASFYSFIQICDCLLAVSFRKLHFLYKKIIMHTFLPKGNKVSSSIQLFWQKK